MRTIIIFAAFFIFIQTGFSQQETTPASPDSSRIASENNTLMRHEKQVSQNNRNRPDVNITSPVYRARPIFDPENPRPQKIERDTTSPLMRARLPEPEREE